MYYNIYYNRCKGLFSRQMGGYIGSKKAAVVYGGLAYLGFRMISEIFDRKKNSPEKLLPEDEC